MNRSKIPNDGIKQRNYIYIYILIYIYINIHILIYYNLVNDTRLYNDRIDWNTNSHDFFNNIPVGIGKEDVLIRKLFIPIVWSEHVIIRNRSGNIYILNL